LPADAAKLISRYPGRVKKDNGLHGLKWLNRACTFYPPPCRKIELMVIIEDEKANANEVVGGPQKSFI